jgi:hypothetical protein
MKKRVLLINMDWKVSSMLSSRVVGATVSDLWAAMFLIVRGKTDKFS